MYLYLCLAFISVSQAFFVSKTDLTEHICLTCCGEPPCCNDCGLSNDLLALLKPVVGTHVDGKQVVPVKRYLDDLFPDQSEVCLDCCGQHPCCSDCGLGDLFGHHMPNPTNTTEQSPEKNENYGGQGHVDLGLPHIDPGLPHIDPGFPHIDPGFPHIDPALLHGHGGGFLPNTDLSKPYWEVLGKKK